MLTRVMRKKGENAENAKGEVTERAANASGMFTEVGLRYA